MGPKGLVRASTVAVAVLSFGLLLLATLTPGSMAATPLTAPDGSPLSLTAGEGATLAIWQGRPILVFKVDADLLAGADATPSIEVPGEPGVRLFAISATSTHLGCTIRWPLKGWAANSLPPYTLLDPCHLGQWDALRSGEPKTGTLAPIRLALLDARFDDGQLVATHFDGPVGRQRG